MLSLIHDLGEVDEGDVPAPETGDPRNREGRESTAVHRVTQVLPDSLREGIRELWDEYHRGETREAAFVRAVDKLETVIQHNQGQNGPEFDYEFNLTYGTAWTDRFDRTRELADMLRETTGRRLEEQSEDRAGRDTKGRSHENTQRRTNKGE